MKGFFDRNPFALPLGAGTAVAGAATLVSYFLSVAAAAFLMDYFPEAVRVLAPCVVFLHVHAAIGGAVAGALFWRAFGGTSGPRAALSGLVSVAPMLAVMSSVMVWVHVAAIDAGDLELWHNLLEAALPAGLAAGAAAGGWARWRCRGAEGA